MALTRTSVPYPEAPKFSAALTGAEIKPGMDLKLDWTPGADARSDDFLVLSVQGASGTNSFYFQTPWPGQEGALSGLSTSATIAGALLKPNAILVARLVSYRPTSSTGSAFVGTASGVMTTLFVGDAIDNNDVVQYRLLPGRVFVQENDRTTPATPTNGGFTFEAAAWAVSNGRLTNVNLVIPGGGLVGLEARGDDVRWETNIVFNSEADLQAAFPFGSYGWHFYGTEKGQQTAASSLAASSWPAPLTIANWMSVQTNSFTNDVTLRWMAFPGVWSPDDAIELSVVNRDQTEVYRYPDASQGDAPLAGTATSITLPRNALLDGENYQARLRYIRVLQKDTLGLDGATGIVGRYAETRFGLGTLVARPLEIDTEQLPVAEVAQDYMAQLEAFGGREPCAWSVVAGKLPGGLSLDSSGLIQGVPYESGAFRFTAQFADSIGNSITGEVGVTVTGTLAPLVITTTNLPDLSDGGFCLLPLCSEGGAPPFQWAITSGRLPLGLKLDSPSGLISGIGEEAGSYPIEIEVKDAAGQMQRRQLLVNVPSVTENPNLRIKQFSALSGQTIRASLNAEPGEVFTVEKSTDLIDWQTLFRTNLPSGCELEWSPPPTGPAFYRVCRGEPEPERHPLTVNVRVDPNSTVIGLLTPAGLLLELTNAAGVVWQLDLPPGAVVGDTPVTMTLIQSLDGMPFNSSFSAGVSFGPEGLRLMAPGTLRATFPENLPADTTGFAFQDDGGDFHLYPCIVNGRTLSFPIVHFSGVSFGHASDSAASNMTLDMACNSQSSAEGMIALLARQGLDSRTALWTQFDNWFEEAVWPHLKGAQANDELLWFATDEFLAWVNLLEKNTYLRQAVISTASASTQLRSEQKVGRPWRGASPMP